MTHAMCRKYLSSQLLILKVKYTKYFYLCHSRVSCDVIIYEDTYTEDINMEHLHGLWRDF